MNCAKMFYMKIRKMIASDQEKCLKIANGLKEWFSRETLEEMQEKLGEYDTFIYEDKGSIKGFLALQEEFQGVLEVVWIAVKKNCHNKGIGTALLEYIVKNTDGGKVLKVKTLDNTEVYKPYEATRAFYEKNGFLKIAVIDPYPGWEEGNPCAIYVKPIR